MSSSETQGQIVGARESLNGRENMTQKKSKERPENLCFSGTNQKPERRRPFGTGLVRHCPQGLFYRGGGGGVSKETGDSVLVPA